MNEFILNILISFIGTIIVAFILLPKLRKLKFGQVVRSEGPKEHLKKSGTPTMGGIIMGIVFILVLGIGALKYSTLLLALIPIVGFGIVGFLDDYLKITEKSTKGLSPIKKIIGLMLVISLFIFSYLYVFNLDTNIIIPVVNVPFNLSVPVFVLFTAFVMLGTSNAVNLTDGLDGLASGVVAIIMTFFTAISFKTGNYDMVILGTTTVGTCLGFLMFNIYPAKMFMGDTGSFILGGAICSIAIILKMPLYLIIVGIVCILETLSVIMQVIYFKLTKGKRLFKMAPLHHHFELCGMKESVICSMFWIITTIFAVVAYYI